MKPEDIPTIRQILEDHDIDGLLDTAQFAKLLNELSNRESVMVTEIGPRIWAAGLDSIIS